MDVKPIPTTTAAHGGAPAPVSLAEVHQSVPVPDPKAGFWRQWLAFSGPAILISVG